MWKHWGTGPVFAYESLLNARRWQVYAGRSVFVLLLLIGLAIVWIGRHSFLSTPGPRPAVFQQMAKLGEWFFYAMAGIQVSLILLAAPAAAAGSICMDRVRGTLAHMMVTDLSDGEIVLGKLGARLAPIIGLIACSVPVAALATLLGGVEFSAIIGLFVVSVSLAVLGCTLALTISVWAAKTHDVLMAVYMIDGLWLLALPIWWDFSAGRPRMTPPDWFQKANPYVLVFAPYTQPGFTGTTDYTVFAGVVLGLSAALAVLVIARLRRVVVLELGRQHRVVRRRIPELKRYFPSWPSPTLDSNPVLWREWHRNRPSKLGRRLWAILLFLCWAMEGRGTYEIIMENQGGPPRALGSGFMLMLVFGFLMLSATVPTALAEERMRGSLDVLLATPLSTRSIVIAKWWGTYRRVFVLMLLPLYVVVFLAGSVLDIPDWAVNRRFAQTAVPLTVWDRFIAVPSCLADFLVSGAMIVSLGLALSTWVHRLSRAIALSVIAFFLGGIGWVFLVEFLRLQISATRTAEWMNNYGWLDESALSLSPIYGPMRPINALMGVEFHERVPIWIGVWVIILIKAAIAWFFLWLTIKTFDRCLGRAPELTSQDRTLEPVMHEELAVDAT